MRTPEECVRDYLRAGDSGDDEALVALLHPEVTVHAPGGRTTSGVAAALAAWDAARQGLDPLEHRVVDLVRPGSATAATVAARVQVTGVHVGPFLGVPATGRTITVDQALFAEVHEGRLVTLWEVVDTGWGLQQLGVLPQRPLSPG